MEHVEERVLHAWPSEPVSVRTVRPVYDSALVSISVPTLRRVAAVRRACLGRDLEDSRRCKARPPVTSLVPGAFWNVTERPWDSDQYVTVSVRRCPPVRSRTADLTATSNVQH